MRKIKLFLATALMFASTLTAAELPSDFLSAVEDVTAALSADNFKQYQQALPALAAANTDAALAPLVDNLSDAKNIDAARRQFLAFSNAVADLALAQPSSAQVFECPMVKNGPGRWVQASGTQIANPYFGKKMLRCGSRLN
ncbi:hypothetical protein FACS1894139_16580 [Planctomycetales bacterium]|nr:hypothetical protein FACS1894107_09910 [Planctomycetales bacterium]GHS98321.1 hypothetical protein FACS1894108_06260 [Planctomycetales bacterium]GHT07772.1 hypothetical protein FACS1894139_16580 [Planctomycetales bacterium]